MKRYERGTVLKFGKHSGESIENVLKTTPSYINWCITNLDHFYIDDEDYEEFSGEFSFIIDPLTEKILAEKTRRYYKESVSNYSSSSSSNYSNYDLESADWNYSPMNESHSPSENPWIDVFGPGEEAEAAYWNCD